MSVTLKMPNGGSENIIPPPVCVLRTTTDFEQEELPEAMSCVWGPGYRIFAAEPVNEILDKLGDTAWARLTTPNGSPTFVNAKLVTKRNEPSPIQDDKRTKSVLSFGAGHRAPRVRVRETKKDLLRIWEDLGIPTAPVE